VLGCFDDFALVVESSKIVDLGKIHGRKRRLDWTGTSRRGERTEGLLSI